MVSGLKQSGMQGFAVAVYKPLFGGAFGITDEALAQSAAQYKALLAE